jgi:hypothetical protein
MNGDNITVIFSDAAGSEWCDLQMNLQTTANQIDDLATAANLATVLANTAAMSTDLAPDPGVLGGPMPATLTRLAKIDWAFLRIARLLSFNKATGKTTLNNSSGMPVASTTATDDGTTVTDTQLGAP